MAADLLADLPPAAQARARALLAAAPWAGELRGVTSGTLPDGAQLVTLIGAGGYIEFVVDGKDE